MGFDNSSSESFQISDQSLIIFNFQGAEVANNCNTKIQLRSRVAPADIGGRKHSSAFAVWRGGTAHFPNS